MRTPNALLVPLTLLVLTSCSSVSPGTAPRDSAAESSATGSSTAGSSTAASGDGHGTIAGAAELAEPQVHLLTLDPAGSVDMLDLADGASSHLADLENITATATDGRYVFASSASEGTMTVIDSGVWTWDHEDHFHYYRAEPKVLGAVEGRGEAVVTPGSSATGVYFPESGEGVVLDNEALAKGELGVSAELSTAPHAGLVVPLSRSTLVTVPGTDGKAATVQVHDDAGEPVRGATAECSDAQGTITTTVGAIIGCDDGALLATLDGDDVSFERIPYPSGVDAPKATHFGAREGRPTVAAVAGDRGAWLLDTRDRSWQFLPTDVPLLQAVAVDDREGHVVALTGDGRVLVLSATTGGTLAATAPLLDDTLADPALLQGVELIADQQRAYLNAPAEQRLYEIDFADGARIARTFEAGTVPLFLAETGR